MLEHQLVVSRTYRFKFKPDFEAHGVCTTKGLKCLHKGGGVFRLEQIASYNDTILAGIDIYTSFFKPLGFERSEYDSYFNGEIPKSYVKVTKPQTITTERDVTVTYPVGSGVGIVPTTVLRHQVEQHVEQVETGESRLKKAYLNRLNFRDYPIYKLVDVIDDTDVIYVPELTIDGFPEVNIYHYRDVNLNINIGYWEDPSELEAMLHAVRERLTAYGVHPLSVDLFTVDHKWMTKEEYADLKSINIPGKEVVMQNTPADKEAYLNQHVIVGGNYLKVVDKETSAVLEGEIAFNSLVKHAQMIDMSLFIRNIDFAKDGTTFKENTQYFNKIEHPSLPGVFLYQKLTEGIQYVIGQPFGPLVYSFQEYTGSRSLEDTAQLELFVRRMTYTETTDKTPVDGKSYFRRNPDNTFTDVKSVSDTTGLYELDEGSGYVPATETDISGTIQLYTRVGGVATSSASNIAILDFTTEKAVDLIGKTFDYTTKFGTKMSVDLTAADLIALSAAQTRVKFPKCEPDRLGVEGTPFDVVFRRNKGRWFQFMYEYTPGQVTPIVMPINDSTMAILPGIRGTILGETGEVWKYTYVVDGSERNNYYVMYTQALQQLNLLMTQNKHLNELVVQLNNRIAAL